MTVKYNEKLRRTERRVDAIQAVRDMVSSKTKFKQRPKGSERMRNLVSLLFP